MDGKSVKAIIFDLDNTLIKTREAGDAAIQKVMTSACKMDYLSPY